MRYFLDIPRIIDGSGAHPGAASPPVEGCGEHGGEESGEPRGARWGAPWGGEWGTPWDSVESAVERGEEPRGARWGARRGGKWSTPWSPPGTHGGFAPLEASLRRVAGVSRPYWCNSPHRSDRRGRNPTSAPGRGTLPVEPGGNPVEHHGTRPADGGFAPLDASLRRVAGVSHPYWCNSPLAVGSTLGRRVGNPVGLGGERGGEESGARHGARCRTRGGGTAGRPDHALTDSEAGARPRAPPPLGPATSQVSRRSSGRPSVVPDPE